MPTSLKSITLGSGLMERRGEGQGDGAERHASPVLAPETAASTLTERAYYEIRRDIRDGTLPPGEALRLAALRERFGVGFTPLREAMMRLVTERFVLVAGQKGFRVAQATREDFDDLIDTRVRLETLLLPEAIANGDDHWEASVLATFHMLSRRPAVDEATGLMTTGWASAHEQFHRALVEAARSVRMKWIWLWLFEHSERYRALLARAGGLLTDDRAAHECLLHAVLARDPAAAVAACRDHAAVFQARVRERFWPEAADR
jgi:GntR family carbon starvation induced transcriptional regulator